MLVYRRCKCLGKRPGSSSLPEADSWLLRRKSAQSTARSTNFCRIHSLPLTCRTLHPHSARVLTETEGTSSTKLMRLTIPQRSTSMKTETALSAVRFREEKRHPPKPPRSSKHRCPKHGLRSGSSLAQVHRRQHLSSQPVGSLGSTRHPISVENIASIGGST